MDSEQPLPDSADPAEDPGPGIRYAAMNHLARREHSALELHRKLRRRFGEHESAIDDEIARLQEENLQSDERFAEAFITSKTRQGKGPVRIAMELQQRGVAEAIVQSLLDEGDPEWFELARQVRCKRFGEAPARTPREQAKELRFLQYRGFSPEQARRVCQYPPDL